MAENKKSKKPMVTNSPVVLEPSKRCCKYFEKRNLLVALFLVILILGISGYLLRGQYLAAIVNGKPVFRHRLTKQLTATYGKEVLENVILENLIKEEAGKSQITISDEEINNEINKISAGLGQGVTLEQALSAQGMTLAGFKEQMKTRLLVYKILDKDVVISDEEINTYVKGNAKTLTATAEADQKTEAKAIIKEQKINEKIQTWISDLLARAKITRFLK